MKVLLNLDNVRLGPLAMSMGMLVLPRVAELKSHYINFRRWDGDISTIKYRDAKQEERRLQKQASAEQEQARPHGIFDMERDLIALVNNKEISEGEFERRLQEALG